jgi:histidyl-tRNA synthetase
MANALQAVRGMNDVLPDASALWERFEDTARAVFAQYGYRNIRVPIVEPTALFVRGIGAFTDVVEHEMYTFEDKLNGDSLTLRPEATAGIVRATIQHNLTYDRPQRVWTTGPMFRHERPQKGRYRQFHQVDVEALGFEGPDADAEQIVMLARLWKALDLPGIELQINSIGNAHERLAHRTELVSYLEHHADALDADARRRLHSNPLRILDSKNPAMQPLLEAAPKLITFIEDKSLAHFDALQAMLRDAGLNYRINPRLVRGLDYYNRTVFEWVATSDALGGQGTVAGGGRYDSLFELLGGAANFACGFAIGVERMILLLEAHGAIATVSPLAYVVHAGDAAAPVARRIGEALRDVGHAVVVNAGGGSFKSQMKKADASGARFALVIGDNEIAAGTVAVKPLRATGEQVAVPAAELASHLAQRAE